MTRGTSTRWRVKGQAIGACNCDYGCPCNFNAPPTKGPCAGVYVFHIEEGQIRGTPLHGLTIAQPGRSPGAIHLGGLTAYNFIDERARPEQRAALVRLLTGQVGGPLAIFAGLTTTWLGPDFGPVVWEYDGPRSYVRCGDAIEVKLAPIRNPVTGVASGFTLLLTHGLFTNQSELMTTEILRVRHRELSFDHSGQYGESFRFDWGGEEDG
jgi:hypothetical protein